MIYSSDFEKAAIDREQNAFDGIVLWLTHQPPETWLWFAQHANWDTCVPVFEWMVEQPTCDAAVIAQLFWAASPAWLAKELASGEDLRSRVEWDENRLARLVLLAWPQKPAFDDGLAPSIGTGVAEYRALCESTPDGDDPLRVPRWLYGPFGSLQAAEGVQTLILDDPDLRGLFFDLGMSFGKDPPNAGVGRAPAASPTAAPSGPAIETAEERRMRLVTGLVLMLPAMAFGAYRLHSWWVGP